MVCAQIPFSESRILEHDLCRAPLQFLSAKKCFVSVEFPFHAANILRAESNFPFSERRVLWCLKMAGFIKSKIFC